MAKTYSLDIFDLLNKLNDANYADVYATLTAEERAGFAPLVAMKWMSGTSDELELLSLNEFVNPIVFSLGKHPHLLMRVLQACAAKKKKRYTWIASKPSTKNVLAEKVIQEALNMSSKEAKKITLPPTTEILAMAESIGWQSDEITKLKKELSLTQ